MHSNAMEVCFQLISSLNICKKKIILEKCDVHTSDLGAKNVNIFFIRISRGFNAMFFVEISQLEKPRKS